MKATDDMDPRAAHSVFPILDHPMYVYEYKDSKNKNNQIRKQENKSWQNPGISPTRWTPSPLPKGKSQFIMLVDWLHTKDTTSVDP